MVELVIAVALEEAGAFGFPDRFLGSLAGSIPPPFVDLLLSHKELVFVFNSHPFDAFTLPL